MFFGYTSPERIEDLIFEIQSNLSARQREANSATREITDRVEACKTGIQRLLDAIKSGIDPALVVAEVNRLLA